MEWLVNATLRPFWPRKMDPVPIAQVAGWDPGLVWTGVKYFAPTTFRSPDRTARSKSLYRLPYDDPLYSVDVGEDCP